MKNVSALCGALALLATSAGTSPAPVAASEAFDHETHEGLFTDCATCHAAITEGGSAFPDPARCAACHDDDVLDAVTWRPPTGPRASNLLFDHEIHAEDTECADCHGASGGARMKVERAKPEACLVCHEEEPHLLLSNDCSWCHVPLNEAPAIPAERVAAFPVPPSHEVEGFAFGEHGRLACPEGGGTSIAREKCAVCHGREFCEQCHVNAPEEECIQAMPADERSLAIGAELPVPSTHDDDFLRTHGGAAFAPEDCRVCHTQESCWTCHAATPEVAAGLAAAGPGRGAGAKTKRHKPASHDAAFYASHGPLATASPSSCAACHDRGECLDCHRPAAGEGSPGYHPAGFLVRHPVEAYSRSTSCADCHHPREFCQSCHQSSGLTARKGGVIGAGFHDGQANFLLGHGPAARRHLESCVTCHVENDCLACHSNTRGRGFNPHGPDFPAARLRERAPSMCTVCHGAAIPGG